MGRTRYLVSAAALGAVIALLGYGFGVRALGLDHGLKSVYTIVAAVLLVVSRRLVRGVDSSDRPRVGWLVAAFVGGAALAAGVSLLVDPPPSLHSLSTHKFPGFTIALPSGKARPGADDYSHGMYTVELDANATAGVGWMPGDGSREELEAMAASEKAGMSDVVRGSRITKIGDRDTIVVDVTGGRRMLFTTLPCDGRAIFVQTIGLSDAMHARIVGSVVCTPEPHGREEVPIVLDAAGLPLVEDKDGHVIYASVGKAMLVATTLPGGVDRVAFRGAVSGLLTNQGLTNVALDPTGGDTVTFTATSHGTSGHGTARDLRCGARGIMILGFAIDAATEPALTKAISDARCK